MHVAWQQGRGKGSSVGGKTGRRQQASGQARVTYTHHQWERARAQTVTRDPSPPHTRLPEGATAIDTYMSCRLPSSAPSIPGSQCWRQLKRQGGEAATLHRPPEGANAAGKDPASTQNMDSHKIYSQPVRGQGRGASRQGVRRPGRRGCLGAQNGLGETGGLTYAPRPPGVTRRSPDIASRFTHSK